MLPAGTQRTFGSIKLFHLVGHRQNTAGIAGERFAAVGTETAVGIEGTVLVIDHHYIAIGHLDIADKIFDAVFAEFGVIQAVQSTDYTQRAAIAHECAGIFTHIADRVQKGINRVISMADNIYTVFVCNIVDMALAFAMLDLGFVIVNIVPEKTFFGNTVDTEFFEFGKMFFVIFIRYFVQAAVAVAAEKVQIYPRGVPEFVIFIRIRSFRGFRQFDGLVGKFHCHCRNFGQHIGTHHC